MSTQSESLKRELTVAIVSVVMTAVLGVIAWELTDRLHWAAKEQEIEDTAKTIADMKDKADSLSNEYVTRREFEDLQKLMEAEHQETLTAIVHIGDRIDHLAMMDGLAVGPNGRGELAGGQGYAIPDSPAPSRKKESR